MIFIRLKLSASCYLTGHTKIHLFVHRTLVFGQSGRTKGPLLFFIGSVLLWAYPMYFLRCIPVTWESLPQTHYTFIVMNVIMWIRLSSSHFFTITESKKLRFFFHIIFFVFLQGRNFLLRSKMPM